MFADPNPNSSLRVINARYNTTIILDSEAKKKKIARGKFSIRSNAAQTTHTHTDTCSAANILYGLIGYGKHHTNNKVERSASKAAKKKQQQQQQLEEEKKAVQFYKLNSLPYGEKVTPKSLVIAL